MSEPKFTYHFEVYLDRLIDAKHLRSLRIGEWFPTTKDAQQFAENSFGFKSGAFDRITIYKVRV